MNLCKRGSKSESPSTPTLWDKLCFYLNGSTHVIRGLTQFSFGTRGLNYNRTERFVALATVDFTAWLCWLWKEKLRSLFGSLTFGLHIKTVSNSVKLCYLPPLYQLCHHTSSGCLLCLLKYLSLYLCHGWKQGESLK